MQIFMSSPPYLDNAWYLLNDEELELHARSFPIWTNYHTLHVLRLPKQLIPPILRVGHFFPIENTIYAMNKMLRYFAYFKLDAKTKKFRILIKQMVILKLKYFPHRFCIILSHFRIHLLWLSLSLNCTLSFSPMRCVIFREVKLFRFYEMSTAFKLTRQLLQKCWFFPFCSGNNMNFGASVWVWFFARTTFRPSSIIVRSISDRTTELKQKTTRLCVCFREKTIA